MLFRSLSIVPEVQTPAPVDAATIGAAVERAHIDDIKAVLELMRLVAQGNAQSGNPQLQMGGFNTLTILDCLEFLLDR